MKGQGHPVGISSLQDFVPNVHRVEQVLFWGDTSPPFGDQILGASAYAQRYQNSGLCLILSKMVASLKLLYSATPSKSCLVCTWCNTISTAYKSALRSGRGLGGNNRAPIYYRLVFLVFLCFVHPYSKVRTIML